MTTVLRVALLCAVTARPICTLFAMGIDMDPTWVQVTPSLDFEAVIVFPPRTTRTQLLGAALSAPPAVKEEAPPVLVLRWKLKPLSGDTTIIA